MAGLIDVGLIKPELAGAFAAGYRGADVARQQAQQAEQQLARGRQQMELDQMTIDRLKEDRKVMLDFQAKLKAIGQDPDLDKLFDAMIATGRPDYMTQGLEGKKRYQDQKEFARIMGLGMPTAAAPAAAPMTAPMGAAPAPSIMRQPMAAPAAAPAPLNVMGTGLFGVYDGARPTNALAAAGTAAAAPAAPVSDVAAPSPLIAQTQARINNLMQFAATASTPQVANNALAQARILQDQLELYSKRGPKPPEPTSTQKEYEFAKTQGFTGTLLDYKKAIAASGAARTTVQLPPQPKAEGEARGKLLVKQYENISDAANIARKTIPSIESNLAILGAGFDTGFGTQAKKAGASVLASLGVKDAEKFAANAETFLANATSSILQKQLEQKGPQTESDAKRIEQIGAQLGKTAQGNKFILTVAREQLQRDIEQRNFYDRWWKANKTYDGAEDAWLAGEGGKSLFDRPAFREFVGATPMPSGAPASVGAAPAATSPYSSMSNEELLRQLGVTPQGKKK